MQRLKGRILLLGALAVLACSVDPTDNEGTPTAITANPEVVFVAQGDSQPVIASVVDEDGQILQSDITASNVGTGIQVVEDPNFLGTTTGVGINRQSRFFVKGVDLTATTFTLNGLGLTKEIQVTSVPAEFAGTFSNLTPALGDTISITAPTGTFFTDASTIAFGGAEPVIVSKDATTITFIPFPNTFGPGLVSAVGVASNPNLTFDLPTPDTLVTDSIIDVGGNVAPTNPALGGTVTLVLPPELRVIPESLTSLTVAGSDVPPQNVAVSPDSLTITFVPPPNADSVVEVGGVVARRLPMYPLRLSTTQRVTTPVIDSVPSTVSDAAPDAGESVTLTSTDGNFTFTPGAGVTVGALAAAVSDVAGDGSSVTFTPPLGATGQVTVSGVDVVGFPLTLPSTAGSITVGTTVTPLAGTDAPGTAPAIAVPALNFSTLLYDTGTFDYAAPIFGGAFGNFPARLYEVTIPADGDYTLTLEWSTGEDLGGYWFLPDGTTEPAFDPSDEHGEGADASPETATNTITAGTYLIAVVNFSATNPTFSLRIDAAPTE